MIRPKTALLFCLLCLMGALRPVHGQGVAQNDYTRVQNVPRAEIDQWVRDQVARSGGDWDHQRYHFVIGFSTGHFGQDPVNAIAMRRLVFSLLNNSFAPGDSVTPVAWEMDVWNIGKPVALTDDEQTRAAFVNEVPYSPRQDSIGGHDVERALYDVITRAVAPDQAHSTIVLLFTNSNQSQGPPGRSAPLFGQDNPKLQAAMRDAGFRDPPVRDSFKLQNEGRDVNVEVTALFPEHIETLSGAPVTSRYPGFARETWQPREDMPPVSTALPHSSPAPKPAPRPKQVSAPNRPFPWPLALVGLIALLALAFFILRGMTHRDSPGVAATAAAQKPAAPVGKPVPGSVQVTVGYGSDPAPLKPMLTASRWLLVRDADGARVQPKEDAPQQPDGSSTLAEIFFEEGRLNVVAAASAQFLKIQESELHSSDHRRLLLKPGEQLLCEMNIADVPEPTRLKIAYKKESQS